MARNDPQIKVRIPIDAKDFIETEAAWNASSLSSEIVRCIRERMNQKARPGVQSRRAMIKPTCRKEKAMNTKQNSTAQKRSQVLNGVSRERLARLSGFELHVVHECLATIDDILTGLMCQPRVFGDSGQHPNLNPAGEILNELADDIVRTMSAVADVALCLVPADKGDGEWRGWLLLKHHMRLNEDLSPFAATAAIVATSTSRRTSMIVGDFVNSCRFLAASEGGVP